MVTGQDRNLALNLPAGVKADRTQISEGADGTLITLGAPGNVRSADRELAWPGR